MKWPFLLLQVAGSTAQLLVACKVKADPNYASTKRLQEAGNAVKKATDNLVRAAQQAIQHEEEHTLILNKWVKSKAYVPNNFLNYMAISFC